MRYSQFTEVSFLNVIKSPNVRITYFQIKHYLSHANRNFLFAPMILEYASLSQSRNHHNYVHSIKLRDLHDDHDRMNAETSRLMQNLPCFRSNS